MPKKRIRKSASEKSKNTKKAEEKSKDVDEQDFPLQIPGNFSILTTDIFLEIMSRIPIKSLCNCKWVCKTWYNLILNPSFAKIHYSKSLENSIAPGVLIYDKFKKFYLIDHEVFDERKTWVNVCSVEFKVFDEMFGTGEFQIVGSVNGLVCFAPSPRSDCFSALPYCVCNPITREYVILPKSPKNKRKPAFSGFGFDSSSNEYKVIHILQTKHSLKAKAEVHTLGVKGWRQIPSVPYIFNCFSTNVLVNGSLHWLTFEPTDSLGIVSFVVRTEECHVIPFPLNIKYEKKHMLRHYLGVLGECLCFLEYGTGVVSGFCEVWVMKEYGVEGSWVKEYMFRNEVMPRHYKGDCKLIKLRNGEFLLQYEGKNLGYYNPESETFRHIVLQNQQRLGYVQADIHVGSLFSPPLNIRVRDDGRVAAPSFESCGGRAC